MSVTLISGADGHIGQAVSRWLLANSDDELLLMVRASNRDEKHAKSQRLGDLSGNSRCRVFYADLRADEPFRNISTSEVNRIVHSAAATSFAVDKQTAREVNVEGTMKMIDFAETCPNLLRFGLVSSLYATGMNSGPIVETTEMVEPEFANHYEWSKWQAEQIVASSKDVPWHIYRVATVLCEDETGTVVQQNAIHNTLRLLFYGMLSVIPGVASTRVYMVTTQYVANAIGRLIVDPADQGVFHVSDNGDDALALGDFIDTVYERFSNDARFARQRILKPRYCDLQSFNTLARAAKLTGGAMGQSLESVSPFAPQLFNDKDVQTNSTSLVLGRDQVAKSADLLRAACNYLAQTRWGLKTLPPTTQQEARS